MDKEKTYNHPYFIVQGKEKSYPFLCINAKDFPGLFIYANNYNGFSPSITYIQKSANILRDINELNQHKEVLKKLGNYFGIYLVLREIDRDLIFMDILDFLIKLPIGNQLISLGK